MKKCKFSYLKIEIGHILWAVACLFGLKKISTYICQSNYWEIVSNFLNVSLGLFLGSLTARLKKRLDDDQQARREKNLAIKKLEEGTELELKPLKD